MSLFSGERWQALSGYLDEAIEMDEHARAAWLESLRAGQPALAADLETLLAERGAVEAEGFLERRPPSRPSVASLAGQTIGAYTVDRLIGQGGMGSVWLARRSDGRFEGVAAIKFLNAALVGRAGDERFSREGRILARLTHPHIAHLVDAGVSSTGQPYLVLEHVEGEHIDRYCDARSLSVEARIRLFQDVLSALAHAHANLIVHRDIKPSNVLVGENGVVKLLDFGIAKLLEGEMVEATVLTQQGGWALTPEYAAPEQVTGGPVTTATDVYALGVLLYVLLTGRRPVTINTGSPADLIRDIVETEPPRLSNAMAGSNGTPPEALAQTAARRATTPDKLVRLLRGDLETIVAKTLKKNPLERYTSVTALGDDLGRYLDRQPISARPDTLAYRTARFVRRHSRGVSAAAAVTLLLASLIGFYTARLAVERDRARVEAEKAAKVSDFLTGLFTGADPFAAQDKREPTVRAILDAGAARIRTDLAGQPEIRAELLTVMGRIYQRLGVYDKAQPLLEEALATDRRLGGAGHARVAQSLNDLGVLLTAKGDFAAAGSALEEALGMRRRLLGNDDKDTAITLSELGRVYDDQGFDTRAEPHFREALAIRRTVFGDDHRETATSKSDLALLLWHKGDLAAAEPLFRESLSTSRALLGPDHPNVSTGMNNVALIVMDRGDYPAAESLFREALTIRRRVLGGTHPALISTLNNLGHALREQTKYDDAESAIQEAVQIARTLGHDHPNLALSLINLARVHVARNEAATAEPLLREALQIRRRAFREDDWRVGAAKSLLGAALTALRKYEEAEALLVDAEKVLKAGPGPQGREAASTRARLVSLYEAWGRPDAAATYRSTARKP